MAKISAGMLKQMQELARFANSPGQVRMRKHASEYIESNRSTVELASRVAGENRFLLDEAARNAVSSFQYVQSFLPDLTLNRSPTGVRASSENEQVDIPLKSLSGIVAINEMADSVSITESIEYFDFISQYPMLGYMHPVGVKIFDFVAHCPKMTVSDLVLHRVRGYSSSRKTPYSLLELLGPPFGVSPQNRFNNIGTRAAYFSDNFEVLSREIELDEHDRYTHIEVRLSQESQLLDIRNLEIPVFSMCHNKVERKNDYFNIEYLIPNYLADCARKTGFDGIVYKSTVDSSSTNYALFYITERNVDLLSRTDILISGENN